MVRGELFRLADRLNTSFWFIPLLMSSLSIGFAWVTLALEEPVTSWMADHLQWRFSAEAEGVSAVLQVVASSMITMAGVVFSMTLVALSLASSQLGPRLLRNFMSDTPTQLVLGTFISTFLYCLVVLRAVRRSEELAFVPHLSVMVGVLLAVASVGVFIYFIHHVSVSIQANEVAGRIGRELIESADQLFPAGEGGEGPEPDAELLESMGRESAPFYAQADGYLQFVDVAALIALARQEDLVFRLEVQPGRYVIAGTPLLRVWPPNRLTRALVEPLQGCFVQGRQRTRAQDIEHGVEQLVEVALRALSPSLNDPFTAMTCIDHLGAALSRLAAGELPSPYRYDDQQRLRLIAPADNFVAIASAAFAPIRQHSGGSAAVNLHLLDTLAQIIGFTRRPQDRAVLMEQGQMIAHRAREGGFDAQVSEQLQQRWETLEAQCPNIASA
ncbi:DUF2254 domain-containing protein [Aestuariirhabdus litorea]|uniref:DUF2254 domain-containing protein n=1 Tax=Aestuariirhabdus litorea TaxID=2528527 RepID=A0A3P3VRE9_9GAMM|nr:DUF2254 domain-containing protein [Aestuariirhabdus litorea]RRJ83383.1 DUF2254 domain-containing protein [Aestuariirhabdus litorea]RWW93542.1 DUF2254 domain-containing protein [Endozoicomonadaceae bacterium GTF-13]